MVQNNGFRLSGMYSITKVFGFVRHATICYLEGQKDYYYLVNAKKILKNEISQINIKAPSNTAHMANKILHNNSTIGNQYNLITLVSEKNSRISTTN